MLHSDITLAEQYHSYLKRQPLAPATGVSISTRSVRVVDIFFKNIWQPFRVRTRRPITNYFASIPCKMLSVFRLDSALSRALARGLPSFESCDGERSVRPQYLSIGVELTLAPPSVRRSNLLFGIKRKPHHEGRLFAPHNAGLRPN